MKSIHFNQIPNMRGKLMMPFTDVVAENFKPKLLRREHEKEMRRARKRLDDEQRMLAADLALLDYRLATR